MKFINRVNPVNPVKKSFRHGFSLMEVLIATGIMAIGMVMVATIFPVGVKLTALTTERTIGAVVADEAFAKVQLYGLRDFQYWPTFPAVDSSCNDFLFTNLYDRGADKVFGTPDDLMIDGTGDFLYPSAVMPAGQDRNYHWSALCRKATGLPTDKEVQVTVFINRKIAAGASYRSWDYIPGTGYVAGAISSWPKPVPVHVQYNYNSLDPPPLRELVIDPTDTINAKWDSDLGQTGVVFGFLDEGYTIINNRDGKLYRIVELKDADGDNIRETIVLQQDWRWFGYELDPLSPPTTAQLETIWVVPPAVGSDRYPCVGVYQKVIRFDNIN